MAAEGSRWVKVIGLGDKRQIMATFAATLDGTLLPMQILYQGKTDRSHPKYTFPDGFDIFYTPNHWANEAPRCKPSAHAAVSTCYAHMRCEYHPFNPLVRFLNNARRKPRSL